MSFSSRVQSLKAQIIDTESLLQMALDHPIMSLSLKDKIISLKEELEALPKEVFDAKIRLLFSGNAVFGSQGIKSTFVGKISSPIQAMIKTQMSLVRFRSNRKRSRNTKAATELYLTALPRGSFGIELSQISGNDLFDAVDISTAMKDVIRLVANSSRTNEEFESTVSETPKQNLVNLKKFLQLIKDECSILKMDSGEISIELSKEEVNQAWQRVSSADREDEPLIISGIFRGLLLDSGRFEIQDEDGKRISGVISEDIEESELINYDNSFLNKKCLLHLRVHKTTFITGNQRINYELMEIRPAS